jgi:hypothetical protein
MNKSKVKIYVENMYESQLSKSDILNYMYNFGKLMKMLYDELANIRVWKEGAEGKFIKFIPFLIITL